MESLAPKRPRPQEEEEVDSEESLKRQKPYNQIISLLESEEEDESPQDLSPLITTLSTLQQEITSSSDETLLAPPARPAENSQATVVHPETQQQQQQQQLASETPFTTTSPVMRHLLEASDDELGIPNSKGWDFGDYDDGLFSSSFMNNNEAEDINGFASLPDGLWELEDETANYYTLLQSQLFL